MAEVVVRLPKPAATLSPNSVCGTTPQGVWQMHLAHVGAVKKARKQAWQLATAAHAPEGFQPREYTLVWYYKGAKRDADNCLASCKAYLDGCADAWGSNDRDWECGGIRRVHSKAMSDCIELRFTDSAFVDWDAEGGFKLI